MKRMLVALAASVAIFAPSTAAARPQVVWSQSCSVEGARCGTVTVPEDRNRPSRRQIPLRVAVYPGAAPRSASPIVFIAGGPGQSAVDFAAPLRPVIQRLAPDRDIVFIDQRGTGGSNGLTCTNGFLLMGRGADDPGWAQCIEQLQQRASFEHYGSDDASLDLEAVRQALGYEQVNLLAASYGVRLASIYMRDYPSRVRTAILRAAAPTDFNILSGATEAADNELGRVIDDCAADTQCRRASPNFRTELERVWQTVQSGTATVSLQSGNGPAETIQVSPSLFHQLLYSMLLAVPSRQQIPFVVNRIATDGFQSVAPTINQLRNAIYDSIPVGMYLSIVCSEDAYRLSNTRTVPWRTPMGAMLQSFERTCRSWPVGPAPARLLRAATLRTPTLVLSGEHDPATTPASAARLVARLPNSRHYVFPATAHGPLFPECSLAAIKRFLDTGRADGPNPDCSGLRMPPFAVPRADATSTPPSSGAQGSSSR